MWHLNCRISFDAFPRGSSNLLAERSLIVKMWKMRGWTGSPVTFFCYFPSFPIEWGVSAKCILPILNVSSNCPQACGALMTSQPLPWTSNLLKHDPKKCILFSHYELRHNSPLSLCSKVLASQVVSSSTCTDSRIQALIFASRIDSILLSLLLHSWGASSLTSG